MNFRTRILTARPSRIIFLVVILAALTPLFLQTENETHAQTGTSAVSDAPALKVVSASASAVELSWTLVSDAVSYDLRTWWPGRTDWQRIDDGSLTGTSDSHDGPDGREEILLHRRRGGQRRRARPLVCAGCGDRTRIQRAHAYANPFVGINADTDANAAAHGNTNAHAAAHGNTNAHAAAHVYANANATAHGNADGDTVGDFDANGNPDANGDRIRADGAGADCAGAAGRGRPRPDHAHLGRRCERGRLRRAHLVCRASPAGSASMTAA